MIEDIQPKILIIEANSAERDLILAGFAQEGFAVLVASDWTEARNQVQSHAADLCLIIFGFKLISVEGMEFRQVCLSSCGDVPFVALTEDLNETQLAKTAELKISAWLNRPLSVQNIQTLVQSLAEPRKEALAELAYLKKIFFEETQSFLEELEPLILSLESQPNDTAAINAIFRKVHTIKGSGAAVGLNALKQFCHNFEEGIVLIKNGILPITPEVISVLLRGLDYLKIYLSPAKCTEALLEMLPVAIQASDLKGLVPSQNQPQKAVPMEAQPLNKDLQVAEKNESGSKNEQIRVPTETLDELMGLSGEITVIRNMVNKVVKSLESSHPGDKDLTVLAELFEEMHKVNARMQAKVVDLRKVPLANVYRPIPRTVRELAKSLKKEINLKTEGEGLRVDTAISHSLSESLIHLIRNAADHGLEDPGERVSQGKSPAGLIHLQAHSDGERVILEIRDDGRGINPEKIKAKALEKNLRSAEVLQMMPKSQLLSLIFEPGFSTAQSVTEVSGRGVGMDMVKTSIEALRGSIQVESELGKGSTFILQIPIPRSVLIINSLLVSAGSQTFVIPQEHIQRLHRISSEHRKHWIGEVSGALTLKTAEGLLPIIHLGQAMGLQVGFSGPSMEGDWDLVQVATEEGQYAIRVDCILDGEEVVVKSVGPHINQKEVFAGLTFLGDGSVGLIIDPKALGREAGVKGQRQGTAVPDLKTDSKEQTYLSFVITHPGTYSLPLKSIYRLEEFKLSEINQMAQHEVLIYRDKIIPLISLNHLYGLESYIRPPTIQCIVVECQTGFVAVEVKEILDIYSSNAQPEIEADTKLMIKAYLIHENRTFGLIDLDAQLKALGLALKTKAVLEVEQKPSLSLVPPLPLKSEELPKALVSEGWGLFE